MALSSELITVIGTLGGAFIGAASGFGTVWITKRSDEKKSMRDLVVKAAIESWGLHKATSKVVLPLDHYIIHSTLMFELATRNNLTPQRLKDGLAEISALVEVMSAHAHQVAKPRTE